MDDLEHHQQWPQLLSPCTSRRKSNDSNSPEFEFWMVRNPSFPQPDLHSADELFSHGILLPLHQLHHHHQQPPSCHQTSPPPPPPTTTTMAPQEEEKEAEPPPGLDRPEPGSDAGAELSTYLNNMSAASAFTSSKRWKDMIFKKGDRKSSRNCEGVDDNVKERDKLKKKEKKKKKKMTAASITGGVGNSGMTAAELNINIWPFRSRSAGNSGTRPRMAAAGGSTRKVSSAPCSRSNSAGESKSRKWPSSPSRGVHLGRSSPVWQLRRGCGGIGAPAGGGRSSEATLKSAEKGIRNEGNESRRKSAAYGGSSTTGGGGSAPRARVLNLNVPMCIGYRHHLSCRSDENSAACLAAEGGGGQRGGGSGQSGGAASAEGVRGSNLFSIRGLFTRKVH